MSDRALFMFSLGQNTIIIGGKFKLKNQTEQQRLLGVFVARLSGLKSSMARLCVCVFVCVPMCAHAHNVSPLCKFVAAGHSSLQPIPAQPTTLVNMHHGLWLH